MNQRVRPSPGPSWAHLQEPSTSSSAVASVDRSDGEDMIFDDDLPTPTRKRKANLSSSTVKRKRVKAPATNPGSEGVSASSQSIGGPSRIPVPDTPTGSGTAPSGSYTLPSRRHSQPETRHNATSGPSRLPTSKPLLNPIQKNSDNPRPSVISHSFPTSPLSRVRMRETASGVQKVHTPLRKTANTKSTLACEDEGSSSDPPTPRKEFYRANPQYHTPRPTNGRPDKAAKSTQKVSLAQSRPEDNVRRKSSTIAVESDVIEISSDEHEPPQSLNSNRPRPPRRRRLSNEDKIDLGVVSITDSDGGSSSSPKVKPPDSESRQGNSRTTGWKANPPQTYRVTEDGAIDLVSDDEPMVQTGFERNNDETDTRNPDKSSEEPGSALLASIESCSIADSPVVEQFKPARDPQTSKFLAQVALFPRVTGLADGMVVENENVNMNSPNQTTGPSQPVPRDHTQTGSRPSVSDMGGVTHGGQPHYSKSPDPLLEPLCPEDWASKTVDGISRGRPLHTSREAVDLETSSRAVESSPDPLADSLQELPNITRKLPSCSGGLLEEEPVPPSSKPPEMQPIPSGQLAPKAVSPPCFPASRVPSKVAGSMVAGLEGDTDQPAEDSRWNQILSPRSYTRSQTTSSSKGGDVDFADNEDSGDDQPRSLTMAASPEQQSTSVAKALVTNVNPPVDFGFYGGVNGHFKGLFTRHPELKAHALISKRSSLNSSDPPIVGNGHVSQNDNRPAAAGPAGVGRSDSSRENIESTGNDFEKVDTEESYTKPSMELGRLAPIDRPVTFDVVSDPSPMHQESVGDGPVPDSGPLPNNQAPSQATSGQPSLDNEGSHFGQATDGQATLSCDVHTIPKAIATYKPEVIDLTLDSDDDDNPLHKHRMVVSATGIDTITHAESQSVPSDVHATATGDVTLSQPGPSSQSTNGSSIHCSSLHGLDYIRAMLSKRKVQPTSIRLASPRENNFAAVSIETNPVTELIAPIVDCSNKVEQEDLSIPLNTKDYDVQDARDIPHSLTPPTLAPNTADGSDVSLPTTGKTEEQECLDILTVSQISDAEFPEGMHGPSATTPNGESHSTLRSSRRSSQQSASRYSSTDLCDTLIKGINGVPTVLTGTYKDMQFWTWASLRESIRQAIPKALQTRNLPHALQDHINAWPKDFRSRPETRTIFEAMIVENTMEDEPDSPNIKIINHVDSQPTPPFEFYYTNHMWYDEGVPTPDLSRLVGCDCVGPCDPKSKTCSCVKRQRQYNPEWSRDFIYNSNGTLKAQGAPIFECNDLCGCSESCINRVVQKGRKCAVNISKTAEKGWGVFAGNKQILGGAFIGIYAGELLLEEVAEKRGKTYNKFGRTYLLDIDFHHLKTENGDSPNRYTVDAYHAGNFTRFLNHSCDPNCNLNPCYINDPDLDRPLICVFANRTIEPLEEICFSYSGDSVSDSESDEEGRGGSDTDGEDDGTEMKIRSDAIYVECRCGAKGCKKQPMFC